ncbi:MAG: hypothetical protein AB8B80_05435 [Marinicellaceae bacterium]
MKNFKIIYKIEKDRYGIDVKYFIELRFKDANVWWCFHPVLPKYMHWKQGDETGIGFDHHTDTQSFDAFSKYPKHNIPDHDYVRAIRSIQEYNKSLKLSKNK